MSGPLPERRALEAIEAVVIGASAGAVSALCQILPALPADYPRPVLIVVHVPADRSSDIPGLFASRCRMRVKEAEDKEPIAPGTIYFAPPNYHLLVEKGLFLSLSSEEPFNYARPSIDFLFESAADAYGQALLGIILTGANHDGAQGLRAIAAAGGLVLVQTPESAEAQTMPRAALAACPGAHTGNVDEITHFLAQA